MVTLILLFIVKIIDNLILTAKSIALYKDKKILSVLLVIVSQFMFYFVVKQIMLDDSMVSIFLISVASGIGTYLAFKINDKFKKDILYVNILTCKDKGHITKLCDFLILNKIKYIVNDSYSRSWQPRYSILIFANTKEQSKMIDDYLSKCDYRYLRQIIK